LISQGSVILGTPHMQIMAINFATIMGNYLIAKHQALQWFCQYCFSLQGLKKYFPFKAIVKFQFVNHGIFARFHVNPSM
jgi:hypothetical protein